MPAGFFVSVTGRDPKEPNGLVALLWAGAAVLAVGLVSAGIGLILTYLTVMVAFMNGWIEQWYGKVPAVGKVWL
jgi:hypothetical protein